MKETKCVSSKTPVPRQPMEEDKELVSVIRRRQCTILTLVRSSVTGSNSLGIFSLIP
jgi:hypothetical protein